MRFLDHYMFGFDGARFEGIDVVTNNYSLFTKWCALVCHPSLDSAVKKWTAEN